MTQKHILLIGAVFIIYYFISETLSWLYCKFTGIKDYESDEVYAARAGIFMMPILVPLMVCLWFMREVLRFGKRILGGRDVD